MKGCYKTKDILKRGTILCMAAMLSFGTVACGSNSSKSASSSEKSTESSASSSTEAGKSTESTSGLYRGEGARCFCGFVSDKYEQIIVE